MPAERRRKGLALALFAAALAYFAAGLGAREASLLESQDLGIACNLFDDLTLSLDHSPLHFVFLNLWQRLNASSFAFLRLPSAVFCAAAVAVVFDLAAMEAGLLAGVAAAVFLAVNPLVVDNARSTRMYSLVLLLAALCLRYAYVYLQRGRTGAALGGFITCALIAVYTHLYSALLVASLVLLLAVDLYRRRADRMLLRLWHRRGTLAGVLLVPQLVHALAALQFVQERHARYLGVSSNLPDFLKSVLETTLLGEDAPDRAWLRLTMIVPLALLLLGVAALRRRGAYAAAAIFIPALGISWALSRSSEIEARYLNYLLPAIAVFQGIGLAQRVPALLRGPVAIALVAGSLYVTHLTYDVTPSDWYAAGARVLGLKRAKTAIAVFPAYWAATFRRYSAGTEAIPIALPSNWSVCSRADDACCWCATSRSISATSRPRSRRGRA